MVTSPSTTSLFTAPYAFPTPLPNQIDQTSGGYDGAPPTFPFTAPYYPSPPPAYPPPPPFPGGHCYPSPPPAYPPPPPFPYAHYTYPHPQSPPGFFTPPPPGFYPLPYAPPHGFLATQSCEATPNPIDTNGEPNWSSPAPDPSPRSTILDEPQRLTSDQYLDRFPASSTTNRDDAVSLAQQPLDSVQKVFVKRPTPSPALETATIASVSGAVQVPDAALPTAVQFLTTGQFIYCEKPSHKHRGLDIISMPNTGQDHSSSSTTSDLLIDRLASSSTPNNDGGATVRVDCVLQAAKTGSGKIQGENLGLSEVVVMLFSSAHRPDSTGSLDRPEASDSSLDGPSIVVHKPELVSVSAPNVATRASHVPSVTNFDAPDVFVEIHTPKSCPRTPGTILKYPCEHRTSITGAGVLDENCNFSEQNLDEKPPVFDVYNDETEDSSTACVSGSANTPEPLFSSELVDLFASSPNQQHYEDKHQESEPGSDTHVDGKASEAQQYLPLFDVYNDATEDCSKAGVYEFADTPKPLVSNVFSAAFAGNSMQKLCDEEQSTTENSKTCLNINTEVQGFTPELQQQNDEIAAVNARQLRASQLNTVRQSISDQVESLNPSYLTTPWDPGVSVVHAGITRSSKRAPSNVECLKITSVTSCECPGQVEYCFRKPIFSPTRPNIGIDIDQLPSGISKALQYKTCVEESKGVEKLLDEKFACRTGATHSVSVCPWDPGEADTYFTYSDASALLADNKLEEQLPHMPQMNTVSYWQYQVPVINKNSVWDPGILCSRYRLQTIFAVSHPLQSVQQNRYHAAYVWDPGTMLFWYKFIWWVFIVTMNYKPICFYTTKFNGGKTAYPSKTLTSCLPPSFKENMEKGRFIPGQSISWFSVMHYCQRFQKSNILSSTLWLQSHSGYKNMKDAALCNVLKIQWPMRTSSDDWDPGVKTTFNCFPVAIHYDQHYTNDYTLGLDNRRAKFSNLLYGERQQYMQQL